MVILYRIFAGLSRDRARLEVYIMYLLYGLYC